jgi:hypothetical protein
VVRTAHPARHPLIFTSDISKPSTGIRPAFHPGLDPINKGVDRVFAFGIDPPLGQARSDSYERQS